MSQEEKAIAAGIELAGVMGERDALEDTTEQLCKWLGEHMQYERGSKRRCAAGTADIACGSGDSAGWHVQSAFADAFRKRLGSDGFNACEETRGFSFKDEDEAFAVFAYECLVGK